MSFFTLKFILLNYKNALKSILVRYIAYKGIDLILLSYRKFFAEILMAYLGLYLFL